MAGRWERSTRVRAAAGVLTVKDEGMVGRRRGMQEGDHTSGWQGEHSGYGRKASAESGDADTAECTDGRRANAARNICTGAAESSTSASSFADA